MRDADALTPRPPYPVTLKLYACTAGVSGDRLRRVAMRDADALTSRPPYPVTLKLYACTAGVSGRVPGPARASGGCTARELQVRIVIRAARAAPALPATVGR
jgi:hypothetical protein